MTHLNTPESPLDAPPLWGEVQSEARFDEHEEYEHEVTMCMMVHDLEQGPLPGFYKFEECTLRGDEFQELPPWVTLLTQRRSLGGSPTTIPPPLQGEEE